MSESSAVYAGSCNPARRTKQSPILPKQSSSAETTVADNRRGRKQIVSRTARERESLRKLNHSIIEKARRTKINDTLATLKQLIPPDFGYSKKNSDDGEDDEYVGTKKKKGKEEKEKEFKLEILVRTVAYMQTLLDKVATLEAAASSTQLCPECSPSKRKRTLDSDEASPAKRAKLDAAQVPVGLPSIASWLPQIDPSLIPSSPPVNPSHLPSPPSSTHFSPISPNQVPPTLSLSPDEESAASLLLQIGTASSFHDDIRPGQSRLIAHTPSSMFEKDRK